MDHTKPLRVVIASLYLGLWGVITVPFTYMAIVAAHSGKDAEFRVLAELVILFFGMASLIAAYGLWTRQRWARYVALPALAFSAFGFFNILGEERFAPLFLALHLFMTLLVVSPGTGQWLRNEPLRKVSSDPSQVPERQ